MGCRFESCWDRHSDWVRSQFASPGSEVSQLLLLPGSPSPPASNFPDHRLYFPLSLGSWIGTCRDVLTILGLPSG